MASPHSKSTWGADGVWLDTLLGSGDTSVFSRFTVVEMSPPSLSDSSRKISTDAEAGLGPLNSGGGVPFLVVSVFHSALWVTDHSLGLNGNSMESSSLVPPPGFGSRMVSDALRMLSRVDGGIVSASGGGRGRLDEAVVGHLQGLGGDLGGLDVEGGPGPLHRHHAVEAPGDDLLVVGPDGDDGRRGAADTGGHAGQPLGHLGAVGTDGPAELDVGVLEPAGELVDELVVPTLLAGLDGRLHPEALEAVPQAQLLAVDPDLEGVGDRRVALPVLGHFSSFRSQRLVPAPSPARSMSRRSSERIRQRMRS